jgi:DNA polymerase-3 subunit epsilon
MRAKISGLVRPRQIARREPPQKPSYLVRLLSKLGNGSGNNSNARHDSYIELLDRTLEDGIVTEREGRALHELAGEWGLTEPTVRQLHLDYLHSLVTAALEDGVITAPERQQLDNVATMLGLWHELQALLERGRSAQVSKNDLPESPNLAGLTVCFTGELLTKHKGERLTREAAQRLARSAGLHVVDAVTRDLDVLVTCDPQSQSSKARKARGLGTRIMTEAVFWRALGIHTDE